MNTTIQLVDYMSSNIAYDDDENTQWERVDANNLHESGFISRDVKDRVGTECILLQPKDNSGIITLARNSKSDPLTIKVRKVLTSQAENVYENHVEIIKIDGKTARTIQLGEEKTYYPGNYVPELEIDEQDDNGVRVIITPPTGAIYVITYVSAGLAGLVLMAAGVIFIKKKVLTK